MSSSRSLALLEDMFPHHESSFLCSALVEHNGDVTATVDYILGASERTDRNLVVQLLGQLAAEWEAATGETIPAEVRRDPCRLEAFLMEHDSSQSSPSSSRTSRRIDLLARAQQLAQGAPDAARGLLARFTLRRAAAPVPIFKRYSSMLTEPMLPPDEGGDAAAPRRSHC